MQRVMKFKTLIAMSAALFMANVTQGWGIYGHEVRTGRAKVEKWLQGLGY